MNVAIRLGLEQIDYVSNMGELDALLNEQKSAMNDEDWAFVAERFTATGQVAGLEMLQTRYGYDVGASLDQLLQYALVEGQTTDTITADGQQIPLARHVQRLLEAGANADRLENAEELAHQVRKNPEYIIGLLRSNPSYTTHPYTAHLPAVPPTSTTGRTDSVNTSPLERALATLRESSGQNWQHHADSGRVYLEVKGMDSVTEASNALFRYGVPLNYGGKNIIDDKTAIVIPDNVLEQVPDSLLRNAGHAVGLALKETAAPARPNPPATVAPPPPVQAGQHDRPSPPLPRPTQKRRPHPAHQAHTHAKAPPAHPHHPTGSSRRHHPHRHRHTSPAPHPHPHEPKP